MSAVFVKFSCENRTVDRTDDRAVDRTVDDVHNVIAFTPESLSIHIIANCVSKAATHPVALRPRIRDRQHGDLSEAISSCSMDFVRARGFYTTHYDQTIIRLRLDYDLVLH